MKMNKDQLDMLGSEILDACIAVHRELGPGLLESVYKSALMIEFGSHVRKKSESMLTIRAYKQVNTLI